MVSVGFLQMHSLFGGVSKEDLEKIIPLLQEENFSAGDTILREGEDGDCIYFIQSGRVEILKKGENAENQSQYKIMELESGATFGEMELIDIQARSASVRALGPVSCLSLSNRSLYRLYHEESRLYGMIVLNLAREISRRLRRMNTIAFASSSLIPERIPNTTKEKFDNLDPQFRLPL